MFMKQSSQCLQAFQEIFKKESSGGDVVRHLLCRGGKVLMCGSSGSSNTDMFQWKRAHLHNMPLLP